MTTKLASKIALITGGSSGLGPRECVGG